MRDSDPRPMPAEVLRAYRDPIDLFGLLKSKAYSDKDRMDVRDDLLRSLIAERGDVWVPAGSKEVRVSTRVKSFRANPIKAIELMLDVDDFGDADEVMPMLARAMQPRWSRWWESLDWSRTVDRREWSVVVRHVLGPRQLSWLAAQYARTAIDQTSPQERAVCLRAIELTEAWAREPSVANYESVASMETLSENSSATRRTNDGASPLAIAISWSAAAAFASASAASSAARSQANGNAGSAEAAAWAVASAYDVHVAYGYDSASDTFLCGLTKRLITPTLITQASRGVSVRGQSSFSPAMPMMAGAMLGAGAMHLAKRM